MKNYFKILLESRNRIKFAEECLAGNFIGADYGVHTDLRSYLSDDSAKFKSKVMPLYLNAHPGKNREANQAIDLLWTICKEIQKGDIVVCPNGRGTLYFGEVNGEYFFHPDGILQHRRNVSWLPATIKRVSVSKEMKEILKSKISSLTISQHADEIEKYIKEFKEPSPIISPNSEKHLEDFLVENWKETEFGKEYDIYEEDGELVGQQFPSNTGPIDILAISKDKKALLVVELKKGKASDVVVGQIQRYMGFVQEKLATKDQIVKGVIIASEDDARLKNALLVTKNIEFYKYHLHFELRKA